MRMEARCVQTGNGLQTVDTRRDDQRVQAETLKAANAGARGEEAAVEAKVQGGARLASRLDGGQPAST